jgi:hypothetical protein
LGERGGKFLPEQVRGLVLSQRGKSYPNQDAGPAMPLNKL